MLIRIYSKTWLLVLFSLSLFFSNEAFANDPPNDSIPKISLIRLKSYVFKPATNLVRNDAADSIIKPVQASLFKNFLSGLNLGGYYRGYFYSRKMDETYGVNGTKKVIGVGDGYYDPTLFLYVGGAPTPNTSFGAEVIVANPFTLYRGPGYYNNGDVNPYFTTVVRGSISTALGDFNVTAGGIEWMRLTPFTFGDNIRFNRFSTFERRPWDPVGNIKTRYASYYYEGDISQDARFGTQAFKGFMLNGFFKKINTNLDVFYGKTAPNGGIDREKVVQPSQNIGVRIKKNIDQDNFFSLNTFNSLNRSDSIKSKNDVQWNIVTSEFQFENSNITIAGEIGAGRYVSPNYAEEWSEGIILDATLPKKFLFIPLTFRYFQIGRSFTSNVATFNNTTISQVNTGFNGNGTPLNQPFGASLDNVGDLANNRRGGALNTTFKISKFVFSLGTQVSGEMDVTKGGNFLTYGHRINNLVWSRLPGVYPFYNKFGPNNRAGTFYRGAYESVQLSDVNAEGNNQYRKFFNAIDVQVKYKMSLFEKDLYFNYLSTYSSVQNQFSAFTKFDDQAYIRANYQELDVNYQLHKSLILALYGGLETIKGNKYTDLNKEGKGRNQIGNALGVGFDIALSSQTTLFLRQRWFSFKDNNFDTEKFSGNEGTIELKIFF